jgi:hypothetical protein
VLPLVAGTPYDDLLIATDQALRVANEAHRRVLRAIGPRHIDPLTLANENPEHIPRL